MIPAGRDHEIIKLIKAHQKQAIRDELMVTDELGVLEMYLKSSRRDCFSLEALVVCEDMLTGDYGRRIFMDSAAIARDVFAVSQRTFALVAEKKNAGGLAAVIKRRDIPPEEILCKPESTVIVLDGLEYPGNVGTILRTTDAAGFDAVIGSGLKTHIFGTKCVSASRGTVFHVPVLDMPTDQAQDTLCNNGYTVYLSEPEDGTPYQQIIYQKKSAVVVGAERFGIHPSWFDRPHHNIYIPMAGEMSSLNVGVAASLVMYAVSGQQPSKP